MTCSYGAASGDLGAAASLVEESIKAIGVAQPRAADNLCRASGHPYRGLYVAQPIFGADQAAASSDRIALSMHSRRYASTSAEWRSRGRGRVNLQAEQPARRQDSVDGSGVATADSEVMPEGGRRPRRPSVTEANLLIFAGAGGA